MSHSSRIRAGCTAAAFLAIGLTIAAAQSPSPAQVPAQQAPFRSEANFIRVDVYATRDGVPVRDLRASDFDVLEDGKPQKIETFEHVVVRPAGSQDARIEPNTQEEGDQMAANPRSRVFVLFLDTLHSSIDGSHNIAEPLIQLLNQVIGPDDLVGVMTPEMTPSQLVFARKTEVIESALRNQWTWGRRFGERYDDKESEYLACYPPKSIGEMVSPIAADLIARRREQMVLDSLHDLIVHLRDMRDERKAVLAITEGWALYGHDEALLNQPQTGLMGEAKATDVLTPGGTLQPPRTGGRDAVTPERPTTDCDADRLRLGDIDDRRYFRDIEGEANRTNVSFYPIDPRGLPVFDTPIGPEKPLPVNADLASLRSRQDTMRELAENTDGLAILNDNDLAGQLRRLGDDLTSYYLLGYYSTNTKLDGTFRTIKVRVKRPGVAVRNRNGYRAATEADVAAARAASAAPAPDTTRVLDAALADLDRRGTYRPAPDAPHLFHRGPYTGNKLEPAASQTFSRTERVVLEVPAHGTDVLSGRLLDRKGQALPIPVTIGRRTDAATGQQWLTGTLVLAPLGPGDYVVELTVRGAQTTRVLTGVRVTQ
ncbi:MAG TPA: VWA domain-containing protein [Vicinamibacterales bacterium]|nr:VWA domain-containing protein [Vicinamibacterales bacterium]